MAVCDNHISHLGSRAPARARGELYLSSGRRPRDCARLPCSDRRSCDSQFVSMNGGEIDYITWRDGFVRHSGAYKHPRSVFGGRGVGLSAGSGAPRRFEGAEKMTRHVEPPLMMTDFTTTTASHDQ